MPRDCATLHTQPMHFTRFALNWRGWMRFFPYFSRNISKSWKSMFLHCVPMKIDKSSETICQIIISLRINDFQKLRKFPGNLRRTSSTHQVLCEPATTPLLPPLCVRPGRRAGGQTATASQARRFARRSRPRALGHSNESADSQPAAVFSCVVSTA